MFRYGRETDNHHEDYHKMMLARSIFVVDKNNKITYLEIVPEVTSQPDYDKARAALKAAGIEKGSQTTGRGFVGKVTMDQIRKIAEQKMPDLNAQSIEAAAQMIKGSARSMGLQVVE
jgi:ribosomal protein L11